MSDIEFDAEKIRTLAIILNETGLTEIEIESGKSKLRIAKEPAPVSATYRTEAPAQVVAAAPATSVAAAAPAAEAPADMSKHPGAVTSPMVGTAYLSPQPGAANFVKVGDSVREGQTLMIVEAMKVMNPLPAPKSGKVTQIMISDNQPVEFGEVLMIVE